MTSWKKRYDALKSATDRINTELIEVRAQLQTQVMTNDMVGNQMNTQSGMIQTQVADHNKETHEMAEEIQRLRQMVRDLGGDPN